MVRISEMPVVANDAPEVVSAQGVTGDYFRTLGIAAILGRTLTDADDHPGATLVATISHRYWQRRFAGDPNILGRLITANRLSVTIVGVTPEGFHGTRATESFDVTLPLSVSTVVTQTRLPTTWWVEIMGRLAPGVTRQQAAGELEPLFVETVRESWALRPPSTPNPERSAIPQLRIVPGGQGADGPRRDATPMLLISLAIVAAILFIGCVNVVLRETALMVAVGVVVGLPLALVAGRLASGFLFGVAPGDPLTIAGAAGVLSFVAILAASVPVRRALSLNPTQALRFE